MAELSKENDQLITSLSLESEKVGCVEKSKSADEENDFAALKYQSFFFVSIHECIPISVIFSLFKFLIGFLFLFFFRAQCELHKDELIATTEKKNIISNQFKELGKKYLYMIEYSGEQMYNE